MNPLNGYGKKYEYRFSCRKDISDFIDENGYFLSLLNITLMRARKEERTMLVFFRCVPIIEQFVFW